MIERWHLDEKGVVRPGAPPEPKKEEAKPAPTPKPAPDPLADLQARNAKERDALDALGAKIRAAEAAEVTRLVQRRNELANQRRAEDLREEVARLEAKAAKRAAKGGD
jgi:hypothetical protein